MRVEDGGSIAVADFVIGSVFFDGEDLVVCLVERILTKKHDCFES